MKEIIKMNYERGQEAIKKREAAKIAAHKLEMKHNIIKGIIIILIGIVLYINASLIPNISEEITAFLQFVLVITWGLALSLLGAGFYYILRGVSNGEI